METKANLYFAYGSNMEPQQMVKRLERKVMPLGIARLNGYVFGYYGHSILWNLSGTADITLSPDTADYVLGIIYKLNESDLKKLDMWENVAMGRYTRRLIKVKYKNKEISAYTYVLKRDGNWIYSEEKNKPIEKYVKQCADAAHKMKIPSSYVDKYILADSSQT
jgi:gamma-glutamylcyclotransferase (GGCT)/AIG2-like uncharacterized protein YtfP